MASSIRAYPFSSTATEATAGSKVSPGEKLHVGIIDKREDFDVLIKYLQTLGKTKMHSNPTLSVVENQRGPRSMSASARPILPPLPLLVQEAPRLLPKK